ncbi:MAG: glycosyltransferase family 4 protein [Acidobacteria bacterium]|nr:glycosyltransferase family 4 protein [Acidobacteriota bacterium]
MKILSLTAGAAGMYCGTCMRDNALAAELIRQGHDVLLMPVYTPTLTDEENVSYGRVFFNGVSVYLKHRWGLFRHLPGVLDRLLDSRWLLEKTGRRSVSVDPRLLGELTVSMLRGEDGPLGTEFRKLSGWLRCELPPGVIDLPYSLLISLARPLKQATGSPVCCTLQGEDLFLNGLLEPYRSESLALIRRNLEHVDVFVAVSHYYAGYMSRLLSIPRGRIRVVPLGINLDGHARKQHGPAARPVIGYLARIAPEKGFHLLAEAFIQLRRAGLDCRLEAAGYLAEDNRAYLERVREMLEGAGFGRDFAYHGAVDRERKIAFLQSIDVLSVPSTYDEPKGIFALEAMANGIPVVQPRRGSYPEMIERTGGGVLIAPDDPADLAHALRSLLENAGLRNRLGEAGRLGVREHYNIALMARRTLDVYSSIVAGGKPAAAVL